MKKHIVLASLCFLLCLTVGCQESDKWKNAVVVYESVGLSLNDFKAKAKELCDRGEIPPDTCAKLKDGYNKAVDVYVDAGYVLEEAINLGMPGDVEHLVVDMELRREKSVDDIGTIKSNLSPEELYQRYQELIAKSKQMIFTLIKIIHEETK